MAEDNQDKNLVRTTSSESNLSALNNLELDFDYGRWTQFPVDRLNLQITDILHNKGYEEPGGLKSSITSDSEIVSRGYKKVGETWINKSGDPVVITPSELEQLQKRMSNLPPDVQEQVFSRYLMIRQNFHEAAKWPVFGRSDAKFIEENPQLLRLTIETAFMRETQNEGALYQDEALRVDWSNSPYRQNAIAHGWRVAREFAEHIPEIKNLK